MRDFFATHIPQISLNLLKADEVPPPSVPEGKWTWPAAEKRLNEAYDKEGYDGWLDAAVNEMEAEGRAALDKRQERSKP